MKPIPVRQCLLATSNKGKIREIRAALKDLDLQLKELSEWEPLPEADESGSSFRENAFLKARHYFLLTGLPTLAEDSGLCVDALGGSPGVHSARLATTDPERIEAVLSQLSVLSPSPPGRSARFISSICLLWPEGSIEVDGEVEGEISDRPRGEGGFGYDPIFFFPPLGRTFAQLSAEEKNRVSHRALALGKLRRALERSFGG